MSYNNSNWMSAPAIQAKTVGQLVFPATHDSGTYALSNQLSTIKYSNIAFLWQLQGASAPVNGTLPWLNKDTSGNPLYYVGEDLYNYIISVIQHSAQSQDSSKSIKAQLNDGIRHFDLRLYYDVTTTPNDFYLQHALRGPSFQDVLNEVKDFINEGGNELIILDVSHTNFKDDFNGFDPLQAVCNMLVNTLGSQNIYTPSGNDLTAAIYKTVLSDITASGTKVIIINTDYPSYSYPSVVFNSPGFGGSGRSPDGVNSVADLISAEQNGLQNHQANPNSFYNIAWTLTAQTQDIINLIFQTLETGINDNSYILQTFADTANSALYRFIQSVQAGNKFNSISCDWYLNVGNNSQAKNVVDIAIALSNGTFE